MSDNVMDITRFEVDIVESGVRELTHKQNKTGEKVKINRPTIAQVESAPIGATLELTRNREQGTPELWVKGERGLWNCLNFKKVNPRFSQGLALTTYAKTTLTIETGE